MNYQVLARKWRPRTFHELIGQEHVVRALTNALDRQRLHHALLFTGTRGVGKTTIARIFAKSLNCEIGVSSTPCGQCAACREIDAGRFVDLIEVDAASRTKVEDTRELLENVQYAPARGRFKVYLIDEVHMLSAHSFNALLKTLEEPPLHVKFLLATTDPQKLPVTVLSRCLQFNLKRLPVNQIAGYLGHVLEREDIPREPAALQLIARAGDGSMRDALSLLDQAIAFGGGRVEASAVETMLGSIDRRRVMSLLRALAAGDASAVMRQVAELDELAPDYAAVLAELLSLLQRVALAQVVPDAVSEDGVADPEDLRQLARTLPPEDVQLFYQIALLGRRDLPLMPEPRGGFEMVLLRMLCFRPAVREVAAPAASPEARSAPVPTVVAPAARPAPPASGAPTQPGSEWGTLVEQLKLTGIAKQVAMNCALVERRGNDFRLALEPGHNQLFNKSIEERLKAALEQWLGAPVSLRVQVGGTAEETPARQRFQQQAERQQVAAEQIAQDPHVRDMQKTFGAQIVTVHPLDETDG
ncbi:MAG: DNA polymerase III subunit gamma/tau [Candidatus Competibacter sp.]